MSLASTISRALLFGALLQIQFTPHPVLAQAVYHESLPPNLSAKNVVGNTFYVAPNGNDADPGTITQPWKTIQKAANTLQAGDTAYIRSGTYNESVWFNKHSGQAGNPITFQAYLNEKPIVTTSAWVGLFIFNQSWIVIDGLTIGGAIDHNIAIRNSSYNVIRNCDVGGTAIQGVYVSSEKSSENTTHNTIVNNDIHDAVWEGVYIKVAAANTTTTDTLVENNRIHNNGNEAVQNTTADRAFGYPTNTIVRGNTIYSNTGDWGIMHLQGNVLVEKNLIYSNKGVNGGPEDGIAYAGGTGFVVRNNVLIDNGAGGASSSDSAIWIELATDAKVYNNTIYKYAGRGIMVKNPTGAVEIKNNILSQVSSLQISWGNPEAKTFTTIDHNLFDRTEGPTLGTNSLVADPRFVNPSNRDLHLQSESPAIDAGVDIEVLDDFDGVPRPQDKGFDIGAYEYEFSLQKEGVPSAARINQTVTFSVTFTVIGNSIAMTDALPV